MSVEIIELIIAICGGLLMISFLALLYVWYVKLEEIESHLQQNTIVMNNKNTWGQAGHVGKMMRFSMIVASFLFASNWARRKLLDIEEVRRFPKNLRYWIFIPFGSGVFLLLLATALLFWIGRI